MTTQTALNLLLGALTLYLGYKNYMMSQSHDMQRESQEMTEIRMKLAQATDLLRDLQKDMKNVSVLSERVVALETRSSEMAARLEKLEKLEKRL